MMQWKGLKFRDFSAGQSSPRQLRLPPSALSAPSRLRTTFLSVPSNILTRFKEFYHAFKEYRRVSKHKMGVKFVYRHACHKDYDRVANSGPLYLSKEAGCEQKDIPYILKDTVAHYNLKSFECVDGPKCSICKEDKIPTVYRYLPTRCGHCIRAWTHRMLTITVPEITSLVAAWGEQHPERPLSIIQLEDLLLDVQTTIRVTVVNAILRIEKSEFESWLMTDSNLLPWPLPADKPKSPAHANTPNPTSETNKFKKLLRTSSKSRSSDSYEQNEDEATSARISRWDQVRTARHQSHGDDYKNLNPDALRQDVLEAAKLPGRDLINPHFNRPGTAAANPTLLAMPFFPFELRPAKHFKSFKAKAKTNLRDMRMAASHMGLSKITEEDEVSLDEDEVGPSTSKKPVKIEDKTPLIWEDPAEENKAAGKFIAKYTKADYGLYCDDCEAKPDGFTLLPRGVYCRDCGNKAQMSEKSGSLPPVSLVGVSEAITKENVEKENGKGKEK
ncbi:hypothetical protein QBC43DRAFT_339631 [Cladorrhinum sp. PSN259]|nr:hypothetical protein QBC43DRAFT_339631 [Cladorrhinum sp. PSN259]